MVEPSYSLIPYISYDAQLREIVFSGNQAIKSLVGKFLRITIKLVNVLGVENEYSLSVQVLAPEQESAAEEGDAVNGECAQEG